MVEPRNGAKVEGEVGYHVDPGAGAETAPEGAVPVQRQSSRTGANISMTSAGPLRQRPEWVTPEGM